MRRYKRNKKNNIIIDLTSLLDVIFIVLLVVMAGQFTASKNQENALADQQTEAESKIEEAENMIAVYEDMIDTMDNVNKYVVAVSIAAPYNKEELHKREIKLLAEGNELKSSKNMDKPKTVRVKKLQLFKVPLIDNKKIYKINKKFKCDQKDINEVESD